MTWIDPHMLVDMSLGLALTAVGWMCHRIERREARRSKGSAQAMPAKGDGPYRTAARLAGIDADGDLTPDQCVDAALRRAGEQLAAGKIRTSEFNDEVQRLTHARELLRAHAVMSAEKGAKP